MSADQIAGLIPYIDDDRVGPAIAGPTYIASGEIEVPPVALV